MTASLCTFAVLAWLPFCAPAGGGAVGYVEGEYVHLAPIDVARIVSIDRRRGDRVKAGDSVAAMETADGEIAVRDAGARLAQAESEFENLRRGRRPEEIAVIEASILAAEAQARDAARVLDRRRDLFGRGFATQAELDQAQTALEVGTARVGELKANLAVAKLAARPEEIEAARSRVAQARAALDQARWRLSQRTIAALADGRVSDVIRHPGEVAGPTAPVMTMLPDGAVKLKLYVPQAALGTLRIGDMLAIACDGCREGLRAGITYIAPEPEFTPPVIYSVENRQKLVVLVEARPDAASAAFLQPGQIVDARWQTAARP